MKTIQILPLARALVYILMGGLLANAVRAADSRQIARSEGVAFDLKTDYIPSPACLETGQGVLEIRSIRIRGRVSPETGGEGSVLLDGRPGTLNPFGDVTDREGPAPEPIPITLRPLTQAEINAAAWDPFPFGRSWPETRKLYELVFPPGQVTGTVRLFFGTETSRLHRLLLYRAKPAMASSIDHGGPHLLALSGEPTSTAALPERPISKRVQLSGIYTAVDGAIRRIGLEGSLGGTGKLEIDPNYITVDAFGELVMRTLMGYQPHDVFLRLIKAVDPTDQGRRLYQLVSDNPRNTNRCCLVLGKTEASPHRLLLYRGEHVRLIVPLLWAAQPR